MTETKKERFERESGWVKARFECTADSIFQALVFVMESDVASFNKLAGEEECTVNRVSEREVTFRRNHRVAAVLTDGVGMRAEVYFNQSQVMRIDIKSKWNDVEMNCDLFIDDEQVSMHRASQKIIGHVLFPQ
ncbi:MAG: hypothetical protein F4027_16390 [Rhodospirillaceae bacterium]|nr:hypothetical protein [Rhodospirillaceae bacterium]MYK60098.1 hypothetical protein [Rhodospirillaceae bacterium]